MLGAASGSEASVAEGARRRLRSRDHTARGPVRGLVLRFVALGPVRGLVLRFVGPVSFVLRCGLVLRFVALFGCSSRSDSPAPAHRVHALARAQQRAGRDARGLGAHRVLGLRGGEVGPPVRAEVRRGPRAVALRVQVLGAGDAVQRVVPDRRPVRGLVLRRPIRRDRRPIRRDQWARTSSPDSSRPVARFVSSCSWARTSSPSSQRRPLRSAVALFEASRPLRSAIARAGHGRACARR